jgi:hypothetical protein
MYEQTVCLYDLFPEVKDWILSVSFVVVSLLLGSFARCFRKFADENLRFR